MNMQQLTEALYRFVARIDDDVGGIPFRLQEHAHLLRKEIEAVHPDISKTLPGHDPTRR